MGVPVSPTKQPGSSMGSFVRCGPYTNAKTLFPALVGSTDYCPEFQAYVDPVIVAGSMRSAQLIKETRVIAELSHRPHKPTFGPKLDVATEKRQRHGRPPSRQVESRGRLIDVLTPDSNFENDRKRSGLCRRLLHLKGNDGHI
ncbi:hypothetical protein PHYPSEUDO_009662 [Phytophthora pseudosyringae]|uniref:Uncharacterized protein n=1 Tax=Phytophthora pseudosyringae TaxID=221518 RepID=A0A8T1W704_9STRA|nr:hypothetical protein PHYPSEUDO_009662 [Phytophthora pseudosyringae]